MTMRWTGAALVAATALVGCSKQEPTRPPLDHGKDAVQAYARTLVANHATLLDSASAPVETVANPRSLVVQFTVRDRAWLSQPLVTKDDRVTRERNLAITETWGRVFCTTELVDVLKSHGIFMVGGQIVDPQGARHSFSACQANTRAESMADTRRLSAP